MSGLTDTNIIISLESSHSTKHKFSSRVLHFFVLKQSFIEYLSGLTNFIK
jgi:hypothetical protein